jgi:hypothetical protein
MSDSLVPEVLEHPKRMLDRDVSSPIFGTLDGDDRVIAEWLLSLSGKSKHTVDAYRRDLREWVRFVSVRQWRRRWFRRLLLI